MILTGIQASAVRLVLRVYFIIPVSFIAWLAKQALNYRARLQLVRTRRVPITRSLDWLQGFDLVKMPWSIRGLPNGKMGYLLMVFLYAISKAVDLIPTTFVQQTEIQSRCSFTTGLVLDTTHGPLFDVPPVNGAPYIVTHNAQIFSLKNSCPLGIYAKVNQDTSFCAAPQDILGTWTCNSSAPVTYQPNIALEDIISDLTSQGLF